MAASAGDWMTERGLAAIDLAKAVGTWQVLPGQI